MTYTILEEFKQDSPEWHEARRDSLGASEVAAVLGLSPWQTPLSVYRTKMGVPNEIPENLAYFGHALEAPIAQWIRDKHPEVGPVKAGISVRSTEYPWLTATPDRLADQVGLLIPIELKTSSAFSKSSWADGVPDYYRIQSIVQQGILGAPHGWLAVLHGGNDPELHRIPFDAEVWEQIVTITKEWWFTHVIGQVEPDPSSMSEMESAKANTGKTVDGDERLLTAWYLDGLERSAYKSAEEQIEAVKAAYKELLSTVGADELTYEGKPLYSWKRSKDVLAFDRAAFERDHPELVQKYTRLVPGSLRFLRKTVKEFQDNPPASWEAGMTVTDVLAQYGELSEWRKTMKGNDND